ncbi:DNA sulfur modification protein DndD [Gammaproteobacteria bacterium]|nr:DNA sulfur modification protein DndD [Gammaproteobacteria bacterium]
MILKQVSLHNYGLFQGEHAIKFAQPSIQRVTLVGGLNGSGKTTIFEAIQICLFGAQSNLHKESSSSGSKSYNQFLLSKINRDVTPGEGSAVELVINLSDDVDITDDLVVTRSWKKTSGGIKEILEVYKNGIIDTDLSENWIEFISAIISPALSKLFLFDGEKILKYAEPNETSALLVRGIQTLVGADLINSLEEDISLLKKNIVKDANPDLEAELADTENEIKESRQNIAKITKKITKLSEKLESDKEKFEKIEIEFQAKGLKSLEKIEIIEKNILKKNIELATLKSQQHDIVADTLPLAMASKQIKTITKKSAESFKVANQELRIESWKERDEFILKNIKSESSIDIKSFKKLLADNIKEEQESIQTTGENNFISTLLELDAIDEEVIKQLKTYKQNKKKIEKISLELESLEKSRLRAPDTSPQSKLFKQRDEMLQSISSTNTSLTEEKTVLENQNNVLLKLENKYKRQFDEKVDDLQASSKQKNQLQRIKLTEKILAEYKLQITKRSIKSFEEVIAQKFKYLLRKDSLISSISIDDKSFSIEALNSKNQKIPLNDLSAGERQLLAISILWALSEISKSNVPVIIDTPLGRLDSKHRKQLITKYFPEAGAQTVILSTDEEIIGEYHQSLKPYIGQEYLCEENKNNESGKIVKGYF